MLGHLTDFLSSDEFMPHGMCFLWRPELIWLHAVSDGLIALSYYSIPFTLIYFLMRRRRTSSFRACWRCSRRSSWPAARRI